MEPANQSTTSPPKPSAQPYQNPDDADGRPAGTTPSDAFREARYRFAELCDYISYFFSAKLDGIRLTVRNIIVMVALAVIGLMAMAGLIITGVVFVLTGIADGLGLLIGRWGAHLLTGGMVLIALCVGVYIGVTRLAKASHLQMVAKYESRKQQQRAHFGHDVDERAAQAGRQ
jgi:hypothetical protein